MLAVGEGARTRVPVTGTPCSQVTVAPSSCNAGQIRILIALGTFVITLSVL
jgi:hypothetical protein